jgi:hypothetical protein
MNFSLRLAQIVDIFEGNARGALSRFARKIDAKPAQVSEWLSGKALPKDPYRRAICAAYPINRQWLDTGDGPMEAVANQPVSERELGRLEGEIKRLENEVNFYRSEIKETLAEVRESQKKSGNSNHANVQHR